MLFNKDVIIKDVIIIIINNIVIAHKAIIIKDIYKYFKKCDSV